MRLDIYFYTTRERGLDEIFPWDFLDCGVSEEFLKREWLRAQEGIVTPNCKRQCQGCGAARFGGGICFEKGMMQVKLRMARLRLLRNMRICMRVRPGGICGRYGRRCAGMKVRVKFAKYDNMRFYRPS